VQQVAVEEERGARLDLGGYGILIAVWKAERLVRAVESILDRIDLSFGLVLRVRASAIVGRCIISLTADEIVCGWSALTLHSSHRKDVVHREGLASSDDLSRELIPLRFGIA